MPTCLASSVEHQRKVELHTKLVDPTSTISGVYQFGVGGQLYNQFGGGSSFGGTGTPYNPNQGYTMYQSPAQGMGGSNPYIF